jgi:lipopolysaccharide transport system permease protein
MQYPIRQALSVLTTLTLRELNTRYAASVFGWFWVVITPLAMLAVYSVVLGALLKPSTTDLGAPSYLAFVASGLWPWMIFADGITRGISAIHANASLVKKVAFPHELLVISSVASAVIPHIFAYVAILAFITWQVGGSSPIGLLGVVWTMLCLIIFTVGVSLLLASVQTILRDVEQGVASALMMLYFLTPVLYTPQMIPSSFRPAFEWNPLAMMITRIREHFFHGPAWSVLEMMSVLTAGLVALLGYLVFRRLSPHFEEFV